MVKPRIYVDTSVIGGCLDDEFKAYSGHYSRNSHQERKEL